MPPSSRLSELVRSPISSNHPILLVLGVISGSPAGPNSSSPCLSASFPGASPTISHADLPWRVTTPSTAPTYNVGSFASSFQSKFLLHVIPPLHLLHEFVASSPSECNFLKGLGCHSPGKGQCTSRSPIPGVTNQGNIPIFSSMKALIPTPGTHRYLVIPTGPPSNT
jgi:hypothetical protein